MIFAILFSSVNLSSKPVKSSVSKTVERWACSGTHSKIWSYRTNWFEALQWLVSLVPIGWAPSPKNLGAVCWGLILEEIFLAPQRSYLFWRPRQGLERELGMKARSRLFAACISPETYSLKEIEPYSREEGEIVSFKNASRQKFFLRMALF